MKIVALGCVIAATLVFALPARAATMSECAAQWKAMKAAKQTEGKTYREFSKACMGGTSAKADTKADPAAKSDLAKEAGAGDVGKTATKKSKKADKADAPAKETKKTKSASPAAERQRACGAEWKADKAAGKVEKGMTWPKYWSACNARKKGEKSA
jgi:hypothetical protein